MKKILSLILLATQLLADIAEDFSAALLADDITTAKQVFAGAKDPERSAALTKMFEIETPMILVEEVRASLAKLLANPINVSPAMWEQLEVPFAWKKWLLEQKGLQNVNTRTPAGEKKEKQQKSEEEMVTPILGKNAKELYKGRFDTAVKTFHIPTALSMIDDLEKTHSDTAPFLYTLITEAWDGMKKDAQAETLRHVIRLNPDDREVLFLQLKENKKVAPTTIWYLQGK